MTTNVTRTIITEGPTKIIIHLLIESDGTDGELTNYVILDPTTDITPVGTVTPPSNIPDTQMHLRQAWYNNTWFDVLLRYNALNPLTVWAFSRDPGDSYMDFRYFAGLKDRSGTDHDGKVMISTNGLADSTASTGTMILEFRKD
jgi:hypothetical protein